MRTLRPLAVAAVALTALAAARPAAAQTRTLDFADLTAAGTYGPSDPIPLAYGSTSAVAITNHTVLGFGSSALANCGVNNPNATLGYYGRNFSSFAQVVTPCQDGRVGQFFLAPTAGQEVRLDAVQLGSWPAVDGVGPARPFQLTVFDAMWNQLFSTSGQVGPVVTLTPGVASTSGLYVQFGTDANVGLGSLTYTVRGDATSVVPEPSTYALLGAGLVGVGTLARRRARGTA